MKLLLDVHHSPAAAKRLRRKGHDVLAAAEDPRWSVLADQDLLRAGAVGGRTIVTENAKDFDRIIRVWSTTGEHHSGVVFTSPRRFHRGGLAYPEDLVVALGRLLTEPSDEDHEGPGSLARLRLIAGHDAATQDPEPQRAVSACDAVRTEPLEVTDEPAHVHEELHMPDTVLLPDRIEVTRPIPAPPAAIFDILRSPAGHVAIDGSGMLQDFTGEPAEKVGDTFVIHMDRESLNDIPLGKYDVTVNIILFERDKEIAWDLGPDIPIPHFYGYRLDAGEDGVTNVTSYYDWSKVSGDLKERFPIVPESALRSTLGILERTVRRGL